MASSTKAKYALVEDTDKIFEKDMEHIEMGNSTYVTDNTRMRTEKQEHSKTESQRSPQEERKYQHWKDSPYAVGLVEPTWEDEMLNYKRKSAHGRGCCSDICSDEIEPPHCGCLCVSAFVCSSWGARRIGNMSVLKESSVTVLEEVSDGNGERRRVSWRKIDIIVGPYWPMLVFITCPLIFGVSFWTGYNYMPGKHPLLIAFWMFCTASLIMSLFGVGFRDPGIMLRVREPPNIEGPAWKWNDQGQTYRPRGALYDTDCAVVIEGFDHTCPWTGTAIGKKNMPAFQIFVSLIFFCLIMDILIMSGAL